MTSRLDFDKEKIWKPATSGAGKGDAPRNVSKQFKENWDRINWTPRETDANGVPKPKRYKKVYGKKDHRLPVTKLH